MEIQYQIEKSERKNLAHLIAELTDMPCHYLGVPSCAYQIGDFMLTKDSVLIFDDRTDSKMIEQLLEKIASQGFHFLEPSNSLIVEVPENLFDEKAFANLDRILENKGNLIKHALQTPHLTYHIADGKIRFPWFKVSENGDADAYYKFISALCDMAKNQKRINHKPDTSDNEKYTFRCFLIRLGFVGNEYKAVRKVLMRNLSGSSAFRNGGKKNEVSKSENS